jgi:RHS repeat-associated protein
VSADVDNDSTADVFYKWDALGRRVLRDDGTTATVFVQSGQQTIADYTAGTAASSPTYTYVYASYIDEPVMRGGSGGLRYYHRNQQYSITALTNGSGTIIERYAYTAYGTPTITDASGTVLTSSADNNRYTYTGREWDSSLSLYYYRARMYDSVAGRFCSRDPIARILHGLDDYAYTSCSPLASRDPSGLCEECKVDDHVTQPLVGCGIYKRSNGSRELMFGWTTSLSYSNLSPAKCYCCQFSQSILSEKVSLQIVLPSGRVIDVKQKTRPMPFDDSYGDPHNPKKSETFSPDGCRYTMGDVPNMPIFISLNPSAGDFRVIAKRILLVEHKVYDTCRSKVVFRTQFKYGCAVFTTVKGVIDAPPIAD